MLIWRKIGGETKRERAVCRGNGPYDYQSEGFMNKFGFYHSLFKWEYTRPKEKYITYLPPLDPHPLSELLP